MSEFLASNEWQWRLARTIVQGVLGVVIANIDLILGYAILDPTLRALVVAFVMAILSPVMAALGGGDGDKPEIPRGEIRGA
ncbi:alanine racemase [Gordonibacter sp. An230]|uniref:alanine racemase n=1 Tax=Gordonibacter sp. An230 TaxID=1965592 RepID=UPI000B3AD300|nr:alanine racemase [Gordonibacter sp. An230]OUO89934.1 alanine racemase [Gordonibacter sp. An230]